MRLPWITTLAVAALAATLLTPDGASGEVIASRGHARLGLAARPKVPGVPLPPRMPRVTRAQCPKYTEPGYVTSCYVDQGPDCTSPTGCLFLAERDIYTRTHELGHAFDAQVLTPADRAWLTRYMVDDEGWCHRHQDVQGCTYAPGTPWFSEEPSDWDQEPGERFADAYANCARRLDPTDFDYESGYGYFPSRRIHRMVCGFIRYVARRAG